MSNINGLLSTFLIIDYFENYKILNSFNKDYFKKGITDVKSFDRFLLNYKPIQNKIRLFINSYSVNYFQDDLIVVLDDINSKKFIGRIDHIFYSSYHPHEFDYSLQSVKFYSTVIGLMNYIQDTKGLLIILKILSNVFQKKKIMEILNEFDSLEFDKLMSSFLVLPNQDILKEQCLSLCFEIIHKLPAKCHQQSYLNKFLFSFTFLDQFLINEDITKIFFQKFIDKIENNDQFKELISTSVYITYYLSFLAKNETLDRIKAISLSELLMKRISEHHEFDDKIIFFYYNINENEFTHSEIEYYLDMINILVSDPKKSKNELKTLSYCLLIFLEKLNTGKLLL